MALFHVGKLETYVAAEPDEVRGFADQTGKVHSTREDAIDANFKDDYGRAWSGIFESREEFKDLPMGYTIMAAEEFIKRNPDMVRVMLGDRDAT